MSHFDWLPTLVAAAGDPDVTKKLLTGDTVGDTTYKVHLDGYKFVPYLSGQVPEGPRDSFFYFSDEGDLMALRYDNGKLAFAVQPAKGTLRVWQQEFDHPRIPFIFNLRTDPFERAPITSNTYYDWLIDRAYLLVPAQAYVGQFLVTFKEDPPRQKAVLASRSSRCRIR